MKTAKLSEENITYLKTLGNSINDSVNILIEFYKNNNQISEDKSNNENTENNLLEINTEKLPEKNGDEPQSNQLIDFNSFKQETLTEVQQLVQDQMFEAVKEYGKPEHKMNSNFGLIAKLAILQNTTIDELKNPEREYAEQE